MLSSNTKEKLENNVEEISSLLNLNIKTNDEKKSKTSQQSSEIRPSQIIYYGVPGSGKSHSIGKIVKELEKQDGDLKFVRRVVFHPEYTNADFVGQILPTMEGNDLKYKFTPGNFTKILRDAYRNPQKNFALIIEEINRGNAAAIFGDIFQLLDRLNSDEEEYCANDQFTYTYGWSKYSIDNSDIMYEIFKNKDGNEGPLFLKIGDQTLHLNYNSGIRLPPNLSLYATMNTSDQNVFTLDNAFQRRWDMKLVENKFEGDDAESQRNAKIGNSNVTWEQFQTHINKKIGEMSSSMGMSSMEDKRLGCWFVKAEDNKISKDRFAEKVLKYLWDDAFKFSREEIFDIKDKTASLESIVSSFKNGDETKPCNWNVFKDTSFVLQQDNTQSDSDAGETK